MFRCRAVLAAFVSTIFTFTNVLFATLPQQTVWAERNKNTAVIPAVPLSVDAAHAAIFSESANTHLPPSFLGRINTQEHHVGARAQTIVLLQDVHGNTEGQQNIAQALFGLREMTGQSAVTVALEGASGEFVYDAFHRCPAPDAARSAVEKLFNQGRLSGPAYAGFAAFPKPGLKPLTFWGVDDATSYRRNVAAYRVGASQKSRVKAQIDQNILRLTKLKKIYFNSELLAFDAASTAYQRGELPMAGYINVLAQHSALPESLSNFKRAIEIESKLNLARVEAERTRVLTQLVEQLAKPERQTLIALSVACQQNEISFGAYYRRFAALCASAHLNLSATPAFDAYVRYALLADALKPVDINRDLQKTEQAVYSKLSRTSEEKNLVAESSFYTWAQLLTDFALTSEQWQEYTRLKIRSAINLSAFETFYRQADVRSAKMVENLLKHVSVANPITVFVVGGFHADQIKTLLAQRGFSYLLASPKITRMQTGSSSAYLSAFDRDKAPLEQLFFGHKLFLAPPVTGAAHPLVVANVVETRDVVAQVVEENTDREDNLGIGQWAEGMNGGAGSSQSLGNRFALMVPFILAALFTIGILAVQPKNNVWQILLRVSEFVFLGVCCFWSGKFFKQYLGLFLAYRQDPARYDLIPEAHDLEYLSAEYSGRAAGVVHRQIRLSRDLFDLENKKSRLTPDQQRDILDEERRHILYQQTHNISATAPRGWVSLAWEEISVNTFMWWTDRWWHQSAGLDQLVVARRETVTNAEVSTSNTANTLGVDPITTTELPIAQKITVLKRFLERLLTEEQTPGSGQLIDVVVISDQHGTIDKFDALILHSIRSVVLDGTIPPDFALNADEALEPQLNPFGITLGAPTPTLPLTLHGKVYFHNLGDFMDRGPYGIKVFNRSVELVRAGLSDFVIGNHDYWMFMNLIGYYLPWYIGFNFYGYKDKYDRYPLRRFGEWLMGGWSRRGNLPVFSPVFTNVAKLVAHHHVHMPETKTMEWWAERFAQVTLDQSARQKEVWSKLDERVNGKIGKDKKYIRAGTLFSKISPHLAEKSHAEKIWEKFRGYYLVDIYMGTRAVENMSVQWWKDLLLDFQREYRGITKTRDFRRNPKLPQYHAWEEAIAIMKTEIIPVLEKRLDDQIARGNWWYRVLEAINYKNYTTPEWWGKDWVFHKDWGTAALSELSAMSGQNVTPFNYLTNPKLIEIANFFKENFTLYQRDVYQNTYMHAFLPVDMDTGEFYFTFQGQEYRGNGGDGFNSVWQGMDRITEIIRKGRSLAELSEALYLVNSWYADNTTMIKAPNVAEAINKFGADGLMDINGINVLFTGHLPVQEFAKLKTERRGIINGFQVGGRIVFTDGGMGERFGGNGQEVVVNGNGVNTYGFEWKDSTELSLNPRIMLPSDNSEDLQTDEPIGREEYLPTVIHRVQMELANPEDEM